MSIIKKASKLARKTIVSDEALNTTVAPVIDMIGKTLSDNVKVPDLLGVEVQEAKRILEELGFIVSVLEKRKPNSKYSLYKVNEVVDMEYPKPNPLLKGVAKGSVVKIYFADEDVLKRSASWTSKLLN
ncbi:hypothetical protein G7081_00490 [Vagococcus coleopterorum]|uniref:PASTA domain-containing protein n=1 Tax=Vagococcus coleopterorum TaxID=2714946 RepID=A0A6G8AL17_9ENTE|nr:PASTA domain-containing protein [Vagococcus coleopterorum]QIL45670.1 hypothetical protein G7081_00490 [Vagococcus coleopterorum]